jgi:hypothetical protein
MAVTGLELDNNGLVGELPPGVNELRSLTRISLVGNRILRPLPELLLRRWDQGRLEISPLSLIHDVSEIAMDVNSPSLLCFGYRAWMSSAGQLRIERRLCRGRVQYCEQQAGRTYEFDRLGRFLVRSGYFGARREREARVERKLGDVTLAATRGGGSPKHKLSSSLEPPTLSDWALGVMLEGIVARSEWSSAPKESVCASEALIPEEHKAP